MKHIYLTNYYLSAMQREINKRLEIEYLDFSYCLDTTYLNDQRGSFEFKVRNITFKIYLPDTEMLGDEFYQLYVIGKNEIFLNECHNLTVLFTCIDQFLNENNKSYRMTQDQDGEYYTYVNNKAVYISELDIIGIDQINEIIYLA